MPPAPTPESSRSSDSLVRAIGTLGLAAAIVNVTVGAGIFQLPSNVASSLGAAAPIAYVVCAVAMGLIVLCIAEAGSRVSLTGGPYAYVGAAFGPYAAFLSGVLLWMLGVFATAAVATVFAASVGQLVPALAPWQPGVLPATFGFWAVVNMRGVALGARLNAVATVAKLAPLLLIAVGGPFLVRDEHLTSRRWPPAADVARTSLLLVFAFAGVESALVPSGEVRDTARTVPRAIALAMLGITALYIALQVSAQGILGAALAGASTPLADAAGTAFGGWARALLLAGAAISMFGYLGGMTLAMPRLVFALARDGYLPRALAAVHPVYRSPQAAIAVQTALDCRPGDLRHLRTPRHPGQRVGAGALPRLRGGGVAPAVDGAGRRRRRCAAAAGRRCAVPGRAGDPVAAHGADPPRVDRLRRVRGRGVSGLPGGPALAIGWPQ